MYLRFEGKDYHVCNTEKLAGLADGASVTATFHRINGCQGTAKDAIVCMMLYPNEGWIQVDRIR